MAGDKITLYTNYRCPWAHRAQIALKELGLEYEEVIIDIDKPREPWYLELNPRGLTPTLKFNDQIITESGVVTRFLTDAYPSHLVPDTGNPTAALTRARINFFVDTWFDKVGSYSVQILRKETDEEKEALVKELVATVGKEIEPLLKDANPFFGGSNKTTLAEVLVAPFIMRTFTLSRNGILPKSIVEGLEGLPNFNRWAAEVVKLESVTYLWNEDAIIEMAKSRIASMKQAAK